MLSTSWFKPSNYRHCNYHASCPVAQVTETVFEDPNEAHCWEKERCPKFLFVFFLQRVRLKLIFFVLFSLRRQSFVHGFWCRCNQSLASKLFAPWQAHKFAFRCSDLTFAPGSTTLWTPLSHHWPNIRRARIHSHRNCDRAAEPMPDSVLQGKECQQKQRRS